MTTRDRSDSRDAGSADAGRSGAGTAATATNLGLTADAAAEAGLGAADPAPPPPPPVGSGTERASPLLPTGANDPAGRRAGRPVDQPIAAADLADLADPAITATALPGIGRTDTPSPAAPPQAGRAADPAGAPVTPIATAAPDAADGRAAAGEADAAGAPPTLAEADAGGDLAAIGPIIVSRPVAAFDLVPEPAPLAEASRLDPGGGSAADAGTRSHLADLLLTGGGYEEDTPGGDDDDSGDGADDDANLLRAWDPGRTWKALGDAIEPLGNVELDWERFRRIESRDGPMAQLSSATSVPIGEIEKFLGLARGSIGDLDAVNRPSGGTAMRSLDTIHLEAGETIWFDVFFDPPSDAAAGDPDHRANDLALITVSVGGRTVAIPFADSASVGEEGATGWRSIKYTAAESGDYTFGFAIIDDAESGPSRLYVDSVRRDDTSGFTFAELSSTTDELGGRLTVVAAAPIAADDVLDVRADAVGSIDLLANDRDPDAFDRMRLVGIDTTGTLGSVRFSEGEPIRYSPGARYLGLAAGEVATDTFRYLIDGGNGVTATGTVTVRITGVNDAPSARADRAAAAEDGAVRIAVLGNDDDIDSDDDAASLRVTAATSAGGATVAVSGLAGDAITYQAGQAFDHLAAGETAVDVVTYVVTDRHGASASGTLSVTVEGRNDMPTALADAAAGTADRPLVIDVVANDRDPDRSDRLRPVAVDGIVLASGEAVALASGALVTLADGRLRYDPAGRFDHLAAGETARDTFRYWVADGQGGFAEAAVTVTVTGVNDAPRPSADSVRTDEDSRDLVIAGSDLLANDSDPDRGDRLRVVAADGPGVRFDGTNLTYDPGGRFEWLGIGDTATERLGYWVADNSGAMVRGEIVVVIEGRNDAPVAVADGGIGLEENAAATFDPRANDRDPDQNDRLSVVAVDGAGLVAEGGAVTLASGARVSLAADGRLTYDASGAFTRLGFQQTAVDTFTYRIADATGATAEASVSVIVTGVNDRPIAVDDIGGAIGQDSGEPVVVDVLANDRDPDDGDSIAIVAVEGQPVRIGTPVTLASGAEVTLLPGGRLAYRPAGAFDYLAAGEVAVETIRYTVRDENGGEATAVAEVTVVGASDSPVAVADRYSVDEDNTLAYDAANGVLANDYDPDRADGRRLFVSQVNGSAAAVGTLITLSSGATVVLNADGSFSYDPRPAYDGLGAFEERSDSLTYTVSDGAGGESTATLTIRTVGQNDPPSAGADRATTHASTPVRLQVLANDGDPEQGGLTVIGIDQAHQDRVRINADGTLTYDPAGRFDHLAEGETATDRFYYTVDDGVGGRATAEVTVTLYGGGAAAGQLVESFEAAAGGLVAGWGRTTDGAATLFSGGATGVEGFRPTHFDQALRLTAAGTGAAGDSALEQYLGIGGTALPADSDGTQAGSGSAVRTVVRFGGADLDASGRLTLTFDWNFLSAETVDPGGYGANDYAIVTVVSVETGKTQVFTLADARTTGDGASGWRTSVLDLTAAFGDEIAAGQPLVIGFAVVNDQDSARPSSLLLDNVRLNGEPGDGAELLISEAGGTFLTYRRAPTAVDDAGALLATDEATALVIDPASLLANDRASPGAAGEVSFAGIDGTAARGAVRFDGTRILYDPAGGLDALAEGETADDRFTYRITDANGGSASGTATVTVRGLNDAPQAAMDTAQAIEDGGTIAIDALANDDDVDSDDSGATLRIIEASAGSGARVWFDAGGGGRIHYDADDVAAYQALAAGETATDTITYRIADRWYGTAGHDDATTTAAATVAVTVHGVNDTPIAANDSAGTDEDGAVGVDVLANDRDPDRNDRPQVIRINGQALSYGNPVVLASGAVVAVTADGRLSYDPNHAFDALRPGQTATDTLVYTVADGQGGSAEATLAVVVAGLNDRPVAEADAIATSEDEAISVSVQGLLANDHDADLGDSLTITGVAGAGVQFDGSTLRYDPGARFQSLGLGETATERLVYTVRDQAGATGSGELVVTITGRNDAPDAVDDSLAVREDRLVSIQPLANDTDPDLSDRGLLGIAGLDTSQTRGVVSVNADGSLTYDPAGRFDYLNAGETAVDRFDYFVSDGHGGYDRATVSITVSGRSNFERLVESFEAPLTWGLPPAGDAERSTTLVQPAPAYQETDGWRQLFLPTDGSTMVRLEARGTLPSDLESFLGLGSGTLARDFADSDGSLPHAGSAMRMQVAVQEGDEVSFDWLFDARDGSYNGGVDNDFALVTVTDSAGVRVYKLSDVRETGEYGSSGWQAGVITARETGTMTIGFASINDRSTEIGDLAQTENSVLLVDNVRINRDFTESYQLVQADPHGFSVLEHAF